MPPWLIEFKLGGEFGLEPGHRMTFLDHWTGTRLFLLNTNPSPAVGEPRSASLTAPIRARLVVEADDADAAVQTAGNALSVSLDTISALSGFALKIEAATAAIEWTPGVSPRPGQAFAEKGGLTDGIVNAAEELPLIERALSCTATADRTTRAMRWFRKGLNEERVADQFVAFWIALEILAAAPKPVGSVPDKCAFCGMELGDCPHCGRELKHRPYPGQAIRHLLCERLGVAPTFFEIVQDVRHAYFHGDDLEELERGRGIDLAEVTDQLGLLLLQGFIRTLRPTREMDIRLPAPSTLRRHYLHAVVVFSYEPGPDDLRDPDPFKVPEMSVSVT